MQMINTGIRYWALVQLANQLLVSLIAMYFTPCILLIHAPKIIKIDIEDKYGKCFIARVFLLSQSKIPNLQATFDKAPCTKVVETAVTADAVATNDVDVLNKVPSKLERGRAGSREEEEVEH